MVNVVVCGPISDYTEKQISIANKYDVFLLEKGSYLTDYDFRKFIKEFSVDNKITIKYNVYTDYICIESGKSH